MPTRTPHDVCPRARELLSLALVRGTFLHLPILGAAAPSSSERAASAPPGVRSYFAAAERTPRADPRLSNVRAIRTQTRRRPDAAASFTTDVDVESQSGAISREARREYHRRRPTKNQRQLYRQLVTDLESALHRDPTRFDLSDVRLPPEAHPDENVRDFLRDRLLKRLRDLRGQLLEACHGQEPTLPMDAWG